MGSGGHGIEATKNHKPSPDQEQSGTVPHSYRLNFVPLLFIC